MKKIKNNKKNQNGFALVLAILLLVVMSIMGVTLVTIVSGDFKENEKRDEYQQALYAAETGVNDAKVWLRKQGLPTNPIVFNGGGVTGWCPISRFSDLSNLSSTYVVGVATSGGKNFNAIINSVDADKTKYENFEFYWFISYPPTWDTASNSYKTTAQIIIFQREQIIKEAPINQAFIIKFTLVEEKYRPLFLRQHPLRH